MPFDLDDVQRIAASEVHSFVQRAPWSSGHVADMQQEVIITLLTASETFDASKGTWRGYAAGASRNAIVRYLKRARLWRREVQMVPLTKEHESIEDHEARPDADTERVARKVRELLNRIDYSPKKVGVAAALKELPAVELARRAGLPVKTVYYARKNLLRNAETFTPLRSLWEELRP